jgi:hypothetical protein
MARHIWSVLCERVLVDASSRSVSLMEVADDIAVEGEIPRGGDVAAPVELALVSDWAREGGLPEQGATRFTLHAPDERLLAEGTEIQVNLVDEERVQTVGQIHLLPLAGPGRYEFVVQYRRDIKEPWATQSRIPLDIREVAHEQPGAAKRPGP